MTQDEIIEMAREAGLPGYPDELEAFAKLVAAKEREACAKLAENRGLLGASKKESSAYQFACKAIAEGIRARGQA
jgi:hypothetical protein